MLDEVLYKKGTTHVRRLRLAPGEAMPWHVDPHHRVTVVLAGQSLAIEYRDGSQASVFDVTPGQVDWDEPANRPHRGVNAAGVPYQEVTIFFLDRPDSVPQPEA
jgi:quercetin dioxygenase-like cupin family protein